MLLDGSQKQQQSNQVNVALCGHSPGLNYQQCMLWSFRGVDITFKQVSHTALLFQCKVSFNGKELYLLSQFTGVDYNLIKHNLPPKTISTLLDVKRTILHVDKVGDIDCPVKVIAVHVQDEVYEDRCIKISV
jgi:hypothetical protein